MARFIVALTLGVTACGGSQARPKALPATTPYLMLFEQGRTWTLPSAAGPVTCKVAAMKQVGDASVSRLDCGSLLVSGTWVAMPAGLYHPYLPVDDPDELTLLGDDDLLLARNPAERDHDHVLAGGARDSIEAFGFEGSWCVRQTTEASTDRRSWTLCFDGKDLTGGSEDTASGTESNHITFGKAPTEDQVAD
jgi:hypothetical protein